MAALTVSAAVIVWPPSYSRWRMMNRPRRQCPGPGSVKLGSVVVDGLSPCNSWPSLKSVPRRITVN